MGEKIANIDNKYGHMIIVALLAISGSLLGAIVYLVKDMPATVARTAHTLDVIVPAVENLADKVELNTHGINKNTQNIATTETDRAGVRREFEALYASVDSRLVRLEAKTELFSQFNARLTDVEGELKSREKWRDKVLDNTKAWRQRTTNELRNHKH